MGLGAAGAVTQGAAVAPVGGGAGTTGAGGTGAGSFAAVLGNALDGLNSSQDAADQSAQALASGNNADLATAVIAAEKANLTLQLAVQLRDKAIGAYQQLMDMQV